MKSFKPKPKQGPEAKIQKEIINFLTLRDWFCKETHGNMFQSGFPDLFVCHKRYGTRWVEVKNPLAYAFTAAQLEDFPKLVAHGAGVWVLTGATEEEYKKLFQPCNWYSYLQVMK